MWLKLNCQGWAQLLLTTSAPLLIAVSPCLSVVTCWSSPNSCFHSLGIGIGFTLLNWTYAWLWSYSFPISIALLRHKKTSTDFEDLQNGMSQEDSLFTKSHLCVMLQGYQKPQKVPCERCSCHEKALSSLQKEHQNKGISIRVVIQCIKTMHYCNPHK